MVLFVELRAFPDMAEHHNCILGVVLLLAAYAHGAPKGVFCVCVLFMFLHHNVHCSFAYATMPAMPIF